MIVVIYFKNHFINVDWMENNTTYSFWLFSSLFVDWNRIFRVLFCFLLLFFIIVFYFLCAPISIVIYRFIRNINCNIWRMNNVMHERNEERTSEKIRGQKIKCIKHNCKQSAHTKSNLILNAHTPSHTHTLIFSIHW